MTNRSRLRMRRAHYESAAEMPAGDDTRIDTADATETRSEQTRAELPAGDATDIEMADIAASPGVPASEQLQIGDHETASASPENGAPSHRN